LRRPCLYTNKHHAISQMHDAMLKLSVNVARIDQQSHGPVTCESLCTTLEPRKAHGTLWRPPTISSLDLHVLDTHEQTWSMGDALWERISQSWRSSLKELDLSGRSFFVSYQSELSRTPLAICGQLQTSLLTTVSERFGHLQRLNLCNLQGVMPWRARDLSTLLESLSDLRELAFDVDAMDYDSSDADAFWDIHVCLPETNAPKLHTLVLNARPSTQATLVSVAERVPLLYTIEARQARARELAQQITEKRHPMYNLANLIYSRRATLKHLHLPGARIDTASLAYFMELFWLPTASAPTSEAKQAAAVAVVAPATEPATADKSQLGTFTFHQLTCYTAEPDDITSIDRILTLPLRTQHPDAGSVLYLPVVYERYAADWKRLESSNPMKHPFTNARTKNEQLCTYTVFSMLPNLHTLAIDGPYEVGYERNKKLATGAGYRNHSTHGLMDALSAHCTNTLTSLTAPMELHTRGALQLANLLNSCSKLAYLSLHIDSSWSVSQYQRASAIVVDSALGHTERLQYLSWPSYFAHHPERSSELSTASVIENGVLVSLLKSLTTLTSLAYRFAWITDKAVHGVKKIIEKRASELWLLDLQGCFNISVESLRRLVLNTKVCAQLHELRWIAPPIVISARSRAPATEKLNGLDDATRMAADMLRRICVFSGAVRRRDDDDKDDEANKTSLCLSIDWTSLIPSPRETDDPDKPWTAWHRYPTLYSLLHAHTLPNPWLVFFHNLALGLR